MPIAATSDFRINIDKLKAGKSVGLRSKHKEILAEMKQLLGPISKLSNPLNNTKPDKEMFSVLIKKFIYITSSVSDEYFLSDICEQVHELFIEFRFILGYFESGKAERKLQLALEDVVVMCKDIYESFKSFLNDPSYDGTNFPKPGKLRAMRELASSVRDVEEVVVLGKSKGDQSRICKKDNKNSSNDNKNYNSNDNRNDAHTAIGIFEHHDNQSKVIANNPLYLEQDNTSTTSISSLLASSSNESSPLSEAPQAPKLYSKEVSAIKSVTSMDPRVVMVAAMNDLMAAPVPPSSTHGRISYVDPSTKRLGEMTEGVTKLCTSANVRNDTTGRSAKRILQGLKPPILVDDEGDILPSTGCPTTFTKRNANNFDLFSVTETPKTPKTPRRRFSLFDPEDENDSFIVAYREEQVKKGLEGEFDVDVKGQESKKVVEFESSGWIAKNRT